MVRIRSATPDDIDFMMALARESSPAAHWTRKQYEQFFNPAEVAKHLVLVATEDNPRSASDGPSSAPSTQFGFLAARHLAPEWELENIVVSPRVQRNGIAKQLLEALFTAARETNSEAVFLEVRESNQPARALYEKLGFQWQGSRKSYYSNPLEDAILYRRALRETILGG